MQVISHPRPTTKPEAQIHDGGKPRIVPVTQLTAAPRGLGAQGQQDGRCHCARSINGGADSRAGSAAAGGQPPQRRPASEDAVDAEDDEEVSRAPTTSTHARTLEHPRACADPSR